jgi:1-deoxy-D-xylulose-5-phosphate reductoisomerase
LTATPRRLAILGSTGSIGTQALEVVAAHPGRFAVCALAAGANVALLQEQALAHPAARLAVRDDEAARQLATRLGRPVLAGAGALVDLAVDPDIDTVVVGLSGAMGLEPTLAALRAGKKVAFANKETLVAGGALVMATARNTPGAEILPVDSEHSALWQVLRGEPVESVARLLITASGGALRERPLAELAGATVAEALAHPTWPSMGRKITVDSATLMNKALEVIEAHYLFGVPYEAIEVLIHPQSAIHGLVEFVDGSLKAQVGPADMRIPIQVALLHPERPAAPWGRTVFADWNFLPVDPARYPALALGYEAGRRGLTLPTVLNAANEVAVEDFLAGRIPFGAIVPTVARVLETHDPWEPSSLEAILEADRWARDRARTLLAPTHR